MLGFTWRFSRRLHTGALALELIYYTFITT